MVEGRPQRIKDSFGALAPHTDALVDRFYERLFGEHPDLRPLFPEDMTQQKRHLLTALSIIVKHIDDFGLLRESLLKMGERHVGYGAEPDHYRVLSATLVTALADLLGQGWTPQLREDWTAAFDEISMVMLEGGEGGAHRRHAA